MSAVQTSVQAALDLQGQVKTAISKGYDATLPPTIVGTIEGVQYERILPLGGVAGSAVTWLIPAGSPATAGYRDLSRSYFKMNLPIRAAGALAGAGGYIEAAQTRASFETFASHMIFQRTRVEIAGVDVSDDASTYQWLASGIREIMTKPPHHLEASHALVIGSNAIKSAATSWTYNSAVEPLTYGDTTTGYSAGLRTAISFFGAGFERAACVAGRGGDRNSWNASNTTRAALALRLAGDGNGYFSGSAPPVVQRVANTVEMTFQPSGIFQSRYYLPGGLSIQVVLEKASYRMPFRSPYLPSPTGPGDLATANALEAYIDWNDSRAQIEFYLATRTVEPPLLEALNARAISQPLQIPFVRARMSVTSFAASATTFSVSSILQGAKPDVVVAFVCDTNSLRKDAFGAYGGEQIASWQFGGNVTETPGVMELQQRLSQDARASPPAISDIQMQWGTRMIPARPYVGKVNLAAGDLGDAVQELYHYYLACSNGALSFEQFLTAQVCCFDLTASGTGRESMLGLSSDMGAGSRGSIDIRGTVVPNLAESAVGSSFAGKPWSLVVIGFGTSYLEISQTTGTARRLGY